jgi:type IV pilus assembly protein PilC
MTNHFTYIARTAVGATTTGAIDANSESEARQRLEARGLSVSSLSLLESAHALHGDPVARFFEKLQRISITECAVFTQNLFVMTKSGIPLAQSIGVLAQQTKNKRFRAILESLKLSLEHGESFSKALSRYPKYFSEVYINMVAAGEASGKLETIFEQLARQLKKERSLRGKIRSALMYPIIVVVAMIAIGIAMMVFVIPKISEIYAETNAQLPIYTRALIGTSMFVVHNGILSAAILIALIVAFRFLSRSQRGKQLLHGFYLRTPIAGTIIQKVSLTRFSRTLQSLLKTDIPIVQSFQIIEHVLGNVHYQHAIHDASESLKKGITIVESLKKWPRLFPPMVTQMISIGEESGRLDELSEEIANFYKEDVDETMSTFSSVIEPVLMLILGVGVGLMAIAILLPMYSLTEQI